MPEDERILQIIPVSVPVWAQYQDDTAPSKVFNSPVQCFALTEDAEGLRIIRAMDMNPEDGTLSFVESAANFIGMTYDINPHSLKNRTYEFEPGESL